jgi:hypothetical protein
MSLSPTTPQIDGISLRSDPPFMLWWIVLVHGTWAVGLQFEPKILSQLVALIGLDWLLEWGISPQILSCVLGSFAILAAGGLIFEERIRERFGPDTALSLIGLCLLPQYFLVLIAFTSDLATLLDPHYVTAGGNPVPTWTLICALAPIIWGATLHTATILQRATLAVRGFPPWPPRGQHGRWVAVWRPE